MVISLCKWLLLPGLLLINGAGVFHPLYVSVTEIDHNAAEKAVQVSCKMFTDDLENTINRLCKAQIDITAPKDSGKVKSLITDYIKKHLVIKTDGRPADLQFVGFERENGAVWSYFQAGNILSVKRIEVVNDLLYESFKSQINIMHVTVNGKRKSLKLNNPDKSAVFDF